MISLGGLFAEEEAECNHRSHVYTSIGATIRLFVWTCAGLYARRVEKNIVYTHLVWCYTGVSFVYIYIVVVISIDVFPHFFFII